MKKLFISALTGMAILLSASNLCAQSSSGTLNVNCTVDPSISITFVSDGGGVTLTGSGSNNATLAFGHVAAFGYTPPSTITQTVNGSTSFSVATPFDVLVTEANTTSSGYTLLAQLQTLDSTNNWYVDTLPVLSTGQTTITSTGSYNGTAMHNLKITIPFSNTTGSVSNVISFQANAN